MLKTLQSRFIAGCVALGLLIVAVAALSLMKSNELVQAALTARLDAVEATFNAAVEQEKLRGYSLAEVSARDPDIIDAFAAGNRELLARRLVPSFKEFKKSHGVQQVQFHLPPATSFFRVHMPEKFGDDLSSFRQTVVDTNKNQKTTLGTEIGVGGFGIRSVVPVSKDGRHIGSFEYGLAFGEPQLKGLAAKMHMSVALYAFEKGQIKLLATTFPGTYQPAQEKLNAAVRETLYEPEVDVAESTMSIRFVPVKDYSGKTAAVVIFGVDRAQFQGMMTSNLRYTGVVTLMALALLGAMAYAFMGNVIRPINVLTAHMRSLASGDLSTRPAATERTDEIGEMCRAVEVFRTSAVARERLEAE